MNRLPIKPVSWSSSRVGDGQDFHPVSRLSEHNEEGESPQQVSTSLGEVRRPLARCLLDSLNGRVEFGHERLSHLGVACLVPFSCGTGFRDRLGMNPGSRRWHYRPRIIRRASAQGTAVTVPESSSWVRLAISSAQATSTSSSTPSSRLSSREAASAARASGDNFNASSKSIAGSGLMCLFYSAVRRHFNLTPSISGGAQRRPLHAGVRRLTAAACQEHPTCPCAPSTSPGESPYGRSRTFSAEHRRGRRDSPGVR
jgi:hypothetical protein